jgi:hypothetical protein
MNEWVGWFGVGGPFSGKGPSIHPHSLLLVVHFSVVNLVGWMVCCCAERLPPPILMNGAGGGNADAD